MLVPTDRLAHTVPGDRPHLPEMRVVEHADGRLVAICDDGISERRVLARDEVVHHRVDEQHLRSVLQPALGLDLIADTPAPLPGTMLVGNISTNPPGAHPVQLLVARSPDHLLGLAGTATSSVPRRVLLTPSRVLWSLAVQELVASRGCAFASLDDVLTWREGALLALQGWRDLVAQQSPHAPAVMGTLSAPLADGVHGLGTVRFNGAEHICELTDLERRFLQVVLLAAETPLEQLMHRGDSAVWKEKYAPSKRPKISQLIARVNEALSSAKPPAGLVFYLPRRANCIERKAVIVPASMTAR